MIDPGVYYNLKSAQEIMRKQTQNASFSIEDGSLQASDQQKIGNEDLMNFVNSTIKEKRKNKMQLMPLNKRTDKKSRENLRERHQKKIDLLPKSTVRIFPSKLESKHLIDPVQVAPNEFP